MRRAVTANLACGAVAAALVAYFWWQGERFVAANGQTFDEAVRLGAGYAHWTGDFRPNFEDPPVLKMWWVLPVVLGERPPYPHEVARATHDNPWHVGAALLYDSGVPYTHLLTPARRMNLVVGCGVVVLAGWWATRAWGSRVAGLAAAAFAATDPNLLAHSCVLTTDVGLTFFTLLTCYLVWEYAEAPSRWLLVAAGVSLGLVLGSKFSAVGGVAGLAAAGGVYVLRGGVLTLPGTAAPAGGWTTGTRIRAAVDLGFRLALVGMVALAATYGVVHVGEWGRGLSFQLGRVNHTLNHYYLCGATSSRGWYHYFLVAVALKVPLGLLAAGALGLLPRGWDRRSVWLFAPPAVFFAAASYSRVDLGVRVVLPALAFLYVFAGRLAAPGCCRAGRLVALAGCLGWAAVSSGQAAPHQLAYFNEVVGGPGAGAKYLADSNVDWGQALPQVKEYTGREGIDAVYLSYFGTARPEAYGIRYQPLPGFGQFGQPGGEVIPADAPRHVVAVSVNNLLGVYLDDPDTFAWLRERTPTAVLGGSIHVYDLTGDADAIRRLSHPR